MNNPIFDLEEDPDNANVLYLGTDYGIWVTIDQGKTWTAFSTSQPTMVDPRPGHPEARPRDGHRELRRADSGSPTSRPIKEFKPEVFEKAARPVRRRRRPIRWNRYERRGDTFGEMVRANNPQVGATIYYYLKAESKNVKITIKDLEGNQLLEVTPPAKKGLQKVFWNLNRQAPPGAAPVGPGGRGGRGGRGGNQVDPGVFKVTLSVDGKEVETKRLTISPDPLFR